MPETQLFVWILVIFAEMESFFRSSLFEHFATAVVGVTFFSFLGINAWIK